jgi:hypothetical protein
MFLLALGKYPPNPGYLGQTITKKGRVERKNAVGKVANKTYCE